MHLKECYTKLGGNYADVIDRLKQEEMIIRFIHIFAQENLPERIKDAIASGNARAAFCAAHSLKGNCMSLGFVRLHKTAEEITSLLRRNQINKAASVLVSLEAEYERTIKIISQVNA